MLLDEIEHTVVQLFPDFLDFPLRGFDKLIRDFFLSESFDAMVTDNRFVAGGGKIGLDTIHIEQASACFIMCESRHLAEVGDSITRPLVEESIGIQHAEDDVLDGDVFVFEDFPCFEKREDDSVAAKPTRIPIVLDRDIHYRNQEIRIELLRKLLAY